MFGIPLPAASVRFKPNRIKVKGYVRYYKGEQYIQFVLEREDGKQWAPGVPYFYIAFGMEAGLKKALFHPEEGEKICRECLTKAKEIEL